MLLDDFLCKDSFTMVNKKLAKIIWIWQMVLLSEMLYQRKKSWERKFPFSQAEMEDELWVSPKTQQRYIKELKELWLISIDKAGTCNKNLYIINDEKIISVCSNGETGLDKLSIPVRTNCPNSPYIYKKEKKEKVKPSLSELDNALNDFEEMRKKIKKPLTSSAKDRLLARLDNLSKNDKEKVAILNQSVDHCWQDVYPLKEPINTEPQTNMEWAQFYDKCYSEWTHKEKILEKYGREKYEKIKSLWVWRCVTGIVDDSFKL